MHRHAQHLFSSWRELFGLGINCTERVQKLFCPFNRLQIRFVEPIEIGSPLDAEGVEEEDNFGEVAPLNFGRVPLGAIQVPALSPQAIASSRRGPARSALPLVR